MSVKLLTEQHLEFLSLTGGYICLFESTLFKRPNCWKSHVAAHMWIGFELMPHIPVNNVWISIEKKQFL